MESEEEGERSSTEVVSGGEEENRPPDGWIAPAHWSPSLTDLSNRLQPLPSVLPFRGNSHEKRDRWTRDKKKKRQHHDSSPPVLTVSTVPTTKPIVVPRSTDGKESKADDSDNNNDSSNSARNNCKRWLSKLKRQSVLLKSASIHQTPSSESDERDDKLKPSSRYFGRRALRKTVTCKHGLLTPQERQALLKANPGTTIADFRRSTLASPQYVSLRRMDYAVGCRRGRSSSAMEDFYATDTTDENLQFFALFDGHRGPSVARRLSERGGLIDAVRHAWKDPDYARFSKPNLLEFVFQQFDSKHFAGKIPSCSVVMLIREPHTLWVVNVGDSEAIKCSFGNKHTLLTSLHRPGNPLERKRLQALPATVDPLDSNLVFASPLFSRSCKLHVSRCFGGDPRHIHPDNLTPKTWNPALPAVKRLPYDGSFAIIMGTAGLWGGQGGGSWLPKEAADLSLEIASLKEVKLSEKHSLECVCEQLLDKAAQERQHGKQTPGKNPWDDATVMIVGFDMKRYSFPSTMSSSSDSLPSPSFSSSPAVSSDEQPTCSTLSCSSSCSSLPSSSSTYDTLSIGHDPVDPSPCTISPNRQTLSSSPPLPPVPLAAVPRSSQPKRLPSKTLNNINRRDQPVCTADPLQTLLSCSAPVKFDSDVTFLQTNPSQQSGTDKTGDDKSSNHTQGNRRAFSQGDIPTRDKFSTLSEIAVRKAKSDADDLRLVLEHYKNNRNLLKF